MLKTGVAQFRLALSLVQGDGMQQDAKEGVKWLMKAAEHGYPPAVELVRRTSSRMNRES